MKRLILFLLVLFGLSVNAQTATAPSGSGTSGDPYLISSLNNLYWIAVTLNSTTSSSGSIMFQNKYFKQTTNIDASGTSAWATGWTPIGCVETDGKYADFIGTYDGQDYVISGLNINNTTTDYIGLFGTVCGATVKNVTLTNVNISGHQYVGALCGLIYSGTTITNCTSSGSVSGSSNDVGGMIGDDDPESGTNSISNSSSGCTVSGSLNCGGLIGSCSDAWGGGGLNFGTISNCYATGNVTTILGTAGGFVGTTSVGTGTITNCYASGFVTGGTDAGTTGGFIGSSGGTVNNCYSTGTVDGKLCVGGFIAVNSGAVTNCYSKGSVTCDTYTAGGFLGSNTGTVNNCYATGTVSSHDGEGQTGGFVGWNNTGGVINNNSFWNTEVYAAGCGKNNGTFSAVGKTTVQMKTQSTFTNASWDFTTVPIWKIDASKNSGYPYLAWAESIDPALPVELTSFTASTANNKVTLTWQTATEVNNYGFEIELRIENGEWRKIGFVQGHGNSNSSKNYSFTDGPNGGIEFKYRLKQIDFDGKFEYSPEVAVNLEVPANFSVKQNFPNPFNPTTKIEFAIPTDNRVQIKVFNVLGMEVATLLNEHRQAGIHNIEFIASNLASGIYFYKVVSGNYSEIKKMILLR